VKTYSKLFGALALTIAVISMPSCGNETHDHDSDSIHDSSGGHEHTYSCPMHPEVTGHEGEMCPKCGMALVHNDNAGNTNEYKMNFTSSVASPNPGEEVTLRFTPKIKGKETEQVALDVVHDKKIHLIIVSKDLSWFDHIHPEYNADGSYSVAEKFPAAGEYTLFADYTPTGGDHQVEKINLTVAGTPAATVAITAQRLTGKAEGYEVTITNDGDFVTNNLLHMGAVIKKDGKEVAGSNLENYLGAKAHVVIIGLNTMEYMHVHPEFANDKFDLHTTFTQPGIYKGWFQFQTNGQVHTADFVLDVKEGKAGDVQGHDDGHAHEGHSH